jgi:hypothetical protein
MKKAKYSSIVSNDPGVIPYVNLESIPISVVTWNVNAHLETVENIREKLLGATNKTSSSDYLIDPQIVVVGIQEMVELSTSSVIGNTVVGQQCQERAQYWQSSIYDSLLEIHPEFELLSSTYMIGLSLFIFAWKGIQSITRNIQVSNLPRGVGGVLGNKGAIYIRMDILDTSICFVNAHFAAHREAVEKRNRDHHAILYTPVFVDVKYQQSIFPYLPNAPYSNSTQPSSAIDPIDVYQISQLKQKVNKLKTKLSKRDASQSELIKLPNTTSTPTYTDDISFNFTTFPATTYEVKKTISADDHDIVIWLGDLNYRIDESVDIDTVYDYIERNDCFTLSNWDQLSLEINKNRVFYQFSEGLLSFPPTYQYIPYTNQYDNRADGKRRCPAWCDRILWRIGKNQRADDTIDTLDEEMDNEIDDEDAPREAEDFGSVKSFLTVTTAAATSKGPATNCVVTNMVMNMMSSSSTKATSGSVKKVLLSEDASVITSSSSATSITPREQYLTDEPIVSIKNPVRIEKTSEGGKEGEVVEQQRERHYSEDSSIASDVEDLLIKPTEIPMQRTISGTGSRKSYQEELAELLSKEMEDMQLEPNGFAPPVDGTSPSERKASRRLSLNLDIRKEDILPTHSGKYSTASSEKPDASSSTAAASATTNTSSTGIFPSLEIWLRENIELLEYTACTNDVSDHKPVRALLHMKVKK